MASFFKTNPATESARERIANDPVGKQDSGQKGRPELYSRLASTNLNPDDHRIH
jgi:hypothetical protein